MRLINHLFLLFFINLMFLYSGSSPDLVTYYNNFLNESHEFMNLALRYSQGFSELEIHVVSVENITYVFALDVSTVSNFTFKI